MLRNLYRNRREAGRWLAEALSDLPAHRVVTIGLGPGGTCVGWEIATRLRTPLDVYVFAEIRTPRDPESIVGLLGPGETRWLDQERIDTLALTDAELRTAEQLAARERGARESIYREVGDAVGLQGRIALLVHDALDHLAPAQMGSTLARDAGAVAVHVAAPVGDPDVCHALALTCERVECPIQPAWFSTPAQFYDDFAHVPDSTVRRMLAASRTSTALEHPHRARPDQRGHHA